MRLEIRALRRHRGKLEVAGVDDSGEIDERLR
jgi:hypothetical protein